MRAVMMARGELYLDEVPDPEPGPGEVLVRTHACGICGSDLHAARFTDEFVATSKAAGGAFKLTTFEPVVLGHEFCAEIVDYGPNTTKSIHPGALVCSVPVLLRDRPVSVGYSTEAPGGFGEYMVLSERMLLRVPAGTPAEAAALTEPMAVGLHAVNKAQLSGDEAVVVMGCGPVGLAVITALKSRGIGPILASDFSQGRRRYALAQGADEALDPRQDNPLKHSEVRRRPLVVFECVGVPGVIDQICLDAPTNTRIVIVGVCMQTDQFRPLIAINKELSMQFVLGYSTDEFQESLLRIADGGFDVAGLISHQVGLEGVADAFQELADPERHAKVIVRPDA